MKTSAPENFEVWAARFSAKVLAFYVGLPILLAFFAVIGSDYVDRIGYDGASIYLLLVALPSWWLVSGLTQLVKVAARRWRPPLWVLTTLGALLSSWPIFLYVMAISDLFHQRWPGGAALPVWPWPQTPGETADLIIRTVRGGAIWVAANYLFDRFFGLPRFRYRQGAGARSDAPLSPGSAPTPAVSTNNAGAPGASIAIAADDSLPPDHEPAILKRLHHAHNISDVLAIKAEEHYVRVYTQENEELVHCRFQDAIQDIDSRVGVQVHRSYWVNGHAIDRVERTESKCEITLVSGLTIPVSQRYREVVRQLVGR